MNNKSTSPNMQCTHILLFGSKFHIILAMYVQMLENVEKSKISKISAIFDIFDIFENITTFSNPGSIETRAVYNQVWQSTR